MVRALTSTSRDSILHSSDAPNISISDTIKVLIGYLKSMTAVTPPIPADADQSKPGRTRVAVAHCLLFTKLLVEVRGMIYRHVLVSQERITSAHDLIGYFILRPVDEFPKLQPTLIQGVPHKATRAGFTDGFLKKQVELEG